MYRSVYIRPFRNLDEKFVGAYLIPNSKPLGLNVNRVSVNLRYDNITNVII